MWTMLTQILVTLIVAVLLAAVVATCTRPSAPVRAWMWQQIAAAQPARIAPPVRAAPGAMPASDRDWARFQQEVLAELARAPRIPPPPVGPPSPGSEVPPLYLYHGTARRNLAPVFAQGIEGRTGGFAFAARDYATAQTYGQSQGGGQGYVVLRIHAQRAYQSGVHFEKRGEYYVTRGYHPIFLDFHWALADLVHREGQGGAGRA